MNDTSSIVYPLFIYIFQLKVLKIIRHMHSLRVFLHKNIWAKFINKKLLLKCILVINSYKFACRRFHTFVYALRSVRCGGPSSRVLGSRRYCLPACITGLLRRFYSFDFYCFLSSCHFILYAGFHIF